MIKKIQRKTLVHLFPNFPQTDHRTDETIFPDVYAGYVLALPSVSAKGNAKLLAVELTKLIILLNYKSMIFMGDTPTPWLYQDNAFQPAQEALQYLEDNEVGKRFNGALELHALRELPEFIKHLFWLVRCNASLPCFNFTDEYYNIIGNLCQHGNVHLYTLNQLTDTTFRTALTKTKFKIIDKSACHERFSRSGAIAHRQIVV